MRGNMPANATMFQYERLLDYVRQRAQSEGNVTLPRDNARIHLIDISLDTVFDRHEVLELAFWKQHHSTASVGRLVKWPLGLAGVYGPPSRFPEKRRRQLATGAVWAVDRIPERVNALYTLLHTSPPKKHPLNKVSVVIYVHCEAGCDRTGELIGAYMMHHLSYNPVRMYGSDTYSCGRSPNYWSTTALEWYCFYLAYDKQTNITTKDCSTFAKCRIFSKCNPTSPLRCHSPFCKNIP
jgi:hypothetical protein